MGSLCQGVWRSPLRRSPALLITCFQRGGRAQGWGGGEDSGGHMLMAKQKPRELYGNASVAVVFRRGL